MTLTRTWLVSAVTATLTAAGTLMTVHSGSSVALPQAQARSQSQSQSQAQPRGANSAAPDAARELARAFEQVAETASPSVVAISSTRRVEMRQELPDALRNSPFRDFFGDDSFGRQQPRLQRGLGSGFVVRENGYILTNSHVVDQADEVIVALSDDREYRAEVVGSDPQSDLAVLRIDASDLQPVELGSSEDLRVGEWVVAVGTPFGFRSTITAGIVSAKGRSRVGLADYEDFIQTDAAINPGNSGGPLLNLSGEVVGINTAIASRTGGYTGIGFAIPVDMAKPIIDSLINEGRVVRGWLGVAIQPLDQDLARSFGYDSTRGVLVGDVTAGGPAAEAGIRDEDIITHFGRQRVETVQELRFAVANTEPGERVPVRVFRDEGETETIQVRIGELETMQTAGRTPQEQSPLELGMQVQTLTPELADRLAINEDLQGVVVTRVTPAGPAAEAGLNPGDIILKVHDRRVRNANELFQALREADLEKGARLVVQTEGIKHFVLLK